MIAIQSDLGMGGILIANPIPEADAIDAAEMEKTISQAVADADRLGVTRKALTPYLLGRIVELTGGRSLTANIALVENNARLAGRIAVALASLGPAA
jgi:pseudouridine-5'-phosphate glycosidase